MKPSQRLFTAIFKWSVIPCDAPTEGDPDNVSGGGEEVLAVVGVGGGGQRPGGEPEQVVIVI